MNGTEDPSLELARRADVRSIVSILGIVSILNRITMRFRLVVLTCIFLVVLGQNSTVSAQANPKNGLQERMARLAEKAGAGVESAEPTAPREGRRIGPADGSGATPSILQSAAPGFAAGDRAKPLGTPDDSSSGWALSTLAALGVVIGLMLVLRWLWVRMGGRVVTGSSPVVEMLSRTSVAPKNHVVLVRVGSRILVCGDSPSGLRTLADIDDEQEVADLLTAITASRDSSITRGFNQVLHRFHGEHDDTRVAGGDNMEHRIDRARNSVSALLANVRGLAGKGGVG